MFIAGILAETASTIIEQPDKVDEIHKLMTGTLGFQFMLSLMIITSILCIVIFQRQKKIAQNQVDLAKLVEALADKK